MDGDGVDDDDDDDGGGDDDERVFKHRLNCVWTCVITPKKAISEHVV